MLSKEQTEEIKKQIIQQIESNFPEEKKESAIEHVLSMNSEQLEQFIEQNKLIKSSSSQPVQQNIFRSIIEEKIPSYKIAENKYALAVLEINPVSKGHIIVIPKKAITSIEKIPQGVFSLAKKLSKKIKTKLKPKEVLISSAGILEEFVINILPIYNKETLDSSRYKANEKELLTLQEKLKTKSEKGISKKQIKKSEKEELPKEFRLPKRIP